MPKSASDFSNARITASAESHNVPSQSNRTVVTSLKSIVYQNIKRKPNCACRGSPRPLCTVPSKLNSRLVVSGCLGLVCGEGNMLVNTGLVDIRGRSVTAGMI